MGLSWTDRLEDVSAQEWDSVLVRSFRPSPFLSRHFLIPWAKTFAAGHPKRIYRWERNGETCGLLFLCLCESAKGWELLGGAPVSDSLAAVVVSGREAEFWSEFLPSSRDFLSLGPLLLPNLVDGSPSIACLPRLCAGLGLSFRLEEMDRSPYVPLPSSFGEYLLLLGKKERHELRRKMRRAEETTPGLSYRVTRTREEFDRDFPSFLALHRKSHLEKADFMDDRMELLARCIEDGIRNGVREYDFLRGRERYKYDLGGRERIVYRGIVRVS